MKIDLEGSVVLEAMDDAVEFTKAGLAAIGYLHDVMEISGLTIAETAASYRGIHSHDVVAERFLDRFDADRLLFAWLVMRGFHVFVPRRPSDPSPGKKGLPRLDAPIAGIQSRHGRPLRPRRRVVRGRKKTVHKDEKTKQE